MEYKTIKQIIDINSYSKSQGNKEKMKKIRQKLNKIIRLRINLKYIDRKFKEIKK